MAHCRPEAEHVWNGLLCKHEEQATLAIPSPVLYPLSCFGELCFALPRMLAVVVGVVPSR